MKLAVLETGVPPGDLEQRFGDYPAMFGAMLGPGFEIETYDVQAGVIPSNPNGHDAFMITGSPAGVYDDFPWIAPLMDFIRAADASPMVGICFGHQVMAEALGGHVEKSDKGWGAGLHTYMVARREPWMNGEQTIAIPASHQDQVLVQPPATEITVRSDFTPYAGLAWRDRPAISFQFHPEFSPDFAKALIRERYDRVSNPDAALASLDAPNDNTHVGKWISNFFMENVE
jgi:GMP synthase-like glutamine amidotransferase